MCRLAYFKRPFAGLRNWLEQLEASCGGDGNGVAVGGGLVKGVHLTVAQTVAEIERHARANRGWAPALWHTRRTSVGGNKDVLCHPFACDDGWLVHNGHWHEMAQEARRFGDGWSDTRMFSVLVERDGFADAVAEHEPPGVWLHMRRDGKLAVWKGSGSLWHAADVGAWGSEPCAGYGDWAEVARGWCGYGCKPETVARGDWYEVFCDGVRI